MPKTSFKKYFIAGLLTWLPLVVTVWMLLWLLSLFDKVFTKTIAFLAKFIPHITDFNEWVQSIPGIGVVVLGCIILLTGILISNIVGQWWIQQVNRLFNRIPVFRTVYSSVKQVSDTLFANDGQAFSKVLLVQYPMKDSWTIGFLTGPVTGDVAVKLPAGHVSVYVPTAPNPTSGFMLIVPLDDVIELDMSIDEAVKYVVSMGVVNPETENQYIPKS